MPGVRESGSRANRVWFEGQGWVAGLIGESGRLLTDGRLYTVSITSLVDLGGDLTDEATEGVDSSDSSESSHRS